MGVLFVVVFDPVSDSVEDGFTVRQWVHADIVALYCFDKGFRDTVGLRALHRREAGFQAELEGEDAGVLRGVAGPVVGEHLDRLRGAVGAEAPLDGFEQHVADVRPADARIDDGAPGDDLPVVGVHQEGGADDLPVPAGELEPVAAPAQVRADHDDLSLVRPLRPGKAAALQ